MQPRRVSHAVIAGFWMPERACAQTLGELIPDEAVENAEAWAEQGLQTEADRAEPDVEGAEEQAAFQTDEIAPELAWPTTDEADHVAEGPLEAEEQPAFAELDLDGDYPAVELAIVPITESLELGLPRDLAAFTEWEEFVGRFAALSTLRMLEALNGSLAQVAVRAGEDEKLLGDLLRVYGYYDGRVTSSIDTVNGASPNGAKPPIVRFDIQPGQQFRIGRVDLGELAGAEEDYAVLRNGTVRANAPD